MVNASVTIAQVTCRNFRCFADYSLDLSHPIMLIEGINGAGKTSLLEALYYACYLRSFRTHSPRDLVRIGQQGFSVKLDLHGADSFGSEIHVGFANGKRVVRINQKPAASYRELMEHYRVVGLTEDDLGVIQGGPEERRGFLDQALVLDRPEYTSTVRAFRQVVENRNALLARGLPSPDLYRVLTEQLWQHSRTIQQERIALLSLFCQRVNALVSQFIGNDVQLELAYAPRKIGVAQTCEAFLHDNPSLESDEMRFRRSLFGAHLDDFHILFQGEKSRLFASRGQQKLIVLLFKIAQAQMITDKGQPLVLLLDDFMTDFDDDRAARIVNALQALNAQLIFTSPVSNGHLAHLAMGLGARRTTLTM